MSPERYRQVNEIVERALDQGEPERSRFIAETCGADAELRSEVERLLARANTSVARDVAMPPLPRGSTMADNLPAQVGRYRIEGEIARGGMGEVVRIRDEDFDRPLAMKVLLGGLRGLADLEQRFLREARLTGVLQHPGIPPVHALGRLPDGRPYFVMKLIQGRSLHDILKEGRTRDDAREVKLLGPRPSSLSPQLVGIFGQICQTLGYAHARGVIHRDLKPSNVMVGAFGEVQVMDWGLAKVLGTNAPHADEPPETIVNLQRTVASVQETTADAIMGTPAYMAPEQARGETAKIDSRTDVFGLGSILCEILTGAAPYQGHDGQEVLHKATQGDLSEALSRLAKCGADPELVDLARRCLSFRRDDRPADGSAVAAAVAAYQAEMERRLRQAELDRAAAAARADEESRRRQAEHATAVAERKRRRLALAFGISFSVLTIVASAAWLAFQQEKARQQADQERRQAELALRREYVDSEVKSALLDVQSQHNALDAQLGDPIQVHDLLSDIDLWQNRLKAMRAAWLRADTLAKGSFLQTLQTEQLQSVERTLDASDRQLAVAKKLDDIRGLASTLAEGSKLSFAQTTSAYADVLASTGLNVERDEPAALAAAIVLSPLRYVLVAALDHWAGLDDKRRGRLLDVARRADPNPWRDRFRSEKAWNDRAALEQLARDVRPEEQSVQILVSLTRRLIEKNLPEPANTLRRAILHRPHDFWLHSELGCVLTNPVEQAGCFQTALAIRPQDALAHSNLAVVLRRKGDAIGAIEHCDEAIKINPKYAAPYNTRGIALHDQKKVDQATAAFREAIHRDPSFAFAYANLADALIDDDHTADAIPVYERTIELGRDLNLDPKFPAACYRGYGLALARSARVMDAIAAYKTAIELNPDTADLCVNLARTLLDDASFAQAAECEKLLVNLLPANHVLRIGATQRLKQAQRLLALQKRLPAVLDGSDAASVTDLLDMATMCRLYGKEKHLATAAHLFQQAFKLQPALMEPYRYSAACTAVLAGSGHGKQPERFSDADRAQLRRQGRDWLQADFDLYARNARDGRFPAVFSAISHLRQWRHDADLASVRDAPELARLPDDERAAWQKLWQDVQHALGVAQHRFSETRLHGTLTATEKRKDLDHKMVFGKVYVVEMESTAFPPFLALFDSQHRVRASNSGIGPDERNSQIVFIPTEDGVFHIVATSQQERGLGAYSLTIREFRD
jgi:serine/threonine protein kinase/Tfp pilus assembly protein PilF